jgi:signal recognition particle GTPase
MANHNGLIIIACLATAAGIGAAAFCGDQYNHTRNYKEKAAVVLQSHEKIDQELKTFSEGEMGKNLEIPDFDASDEVLNKLETEHQSVHEAAAGLKTRNDTTKAIQQDLEHTLISFDTMLESYDDVVKKQKTELLSADKETARQNVETAMEKAHADNQEYLAAKQELQKKLE